MNKAPFLVLLVLLLLSSCKEKKHLEQRVTTGKINTISVVIDDQLWNGEIGDSIRNKFASAVIGLPEEEPLFTINQYPTKLLEGFMTDSRTIIVIKKEAPNKFEIKQNQYASPQNVFHISGTTSSDILDIIEQNAPQIIEIIKKTEITEKQRIINQSILNPNIIKNKFQISIKIPSSYQYVLHKPHFIWLKNEIISGSTSLLIYQVPISKTSKNDTDLVTNIIKIRDSIGNLYISGKENNTAMITGESYAPYFFKIILDAKETYETKGTWELKNDFMSGPFINYAILDKEHNRVLVLEGFCYAPSKEKRDLMHELESIIKSVQVLSK